MRRIRPRNIRALPGAGHSAAGSKTVKFSIRHSHPAFAAAAICWLLHTPEPVGSIALGRISARRRRLELLGLPGAAGLGADALAASCQGDQDLQGLAVAYALPRRTLAEPEGGPLVLEHLAPLMDRLGWVRPADCCAKAVAGKVSGPSPRQ